MKKTLLATAILSGLISATAGAATVYDNNGTSMEIGGRAEVRGDFINGGKYDDKNDKELYGKNKELEGTMRDMSRARINFSGQTQISENLTGFGFMEYEIGSGSTVKNRYLFAGFGTEVGDFSYGRQDTANVQISDMTDIGSEHSGVQTIIDGADSKQNNTFLYSGTFADALTVKVDYIAAEDKDADSFGISGLYDFDFGLDLGASYTSEEDANQATLGASYTWNKLYVAATYAMGEVASDEDFTSLELAAQYQFTEEFRLIGMLGMTEVDDNDTEDYFALEGQYRFNKSMRTYASYKLNNLDGDKEEDSLVVGLRYSF